MDVQDAGTLSAIPRRLVGPHSANRPPSRARVGQALGEWQAAELRHMRGHPHCRGLSHAQLEDLYQETVLALLNRRFFTEEHLRNALRFGLSKRALHVHRDERRRAEILTGHAPEAHLAAMRRSELLGPEQSALTREDGAIVLEFIAELTPLERQLYALEAEGLRYRAIAPIVHVDVNTARKASRSVASKRKRFQLLYDTGRLCGYRAPTIRALLDGEATSEALALGAFAHLEACASCRAEHHTNSRRLRMSFQQRAAALLPVPALAGHLGWVTRVDLRTRAFAARWLPGFSGGAGGVRERVLATAAGSGVAAKIAVGAATIAVIAGGTLGASHLQTHHRTVRASARAGSHAPRAVAHSASAIAAAEPAQQQAAPVTLSRTASRGHRPSGDRQTGFGFLGVPAAPADHAASDAAHTASIRLPEQRTQTPAGEDQHGGGPFSP